MGKSGLTTTPIGLGLAALGRPGYINLGHGEDLDHDYQVESMQTKAHCVLDHAWQAGVRFFDMARSYGKAEAFFSSWINDRGHSDFLLSSKWGYTYTADWQIQAEAHEVKEHSLEFLNRQYTKSRDLLGDHLQLYQIHSATLESGVLDNQPVLQRLHELKQTGLHIGLSVSGEHQSDVIRKAMTIEFDGQSLFDTCQATWNVLETSASEALNEAYQSGMGIIVKEGLANGRLTDRNTAINFQQQRSLLEQLANTHQTTIDAIALAAVLAQPWVGAVLSGAANEEHLTANLQATEINLASDQLEQLANIAEPAAQYWQTRSSLAWN